MRKEYCGIPFLIFIRCDILYLYSCGCSSSVERQLPKLDRRVRLPSSAPQIENHRSETGRWFFCVKKQRSLWLVTVIKLKQLIAGELYVENDLV